MFSSTSGSRSLVINNVLLAAMITLLFFVNFYNKTLFFRPVSIHQWRQSDCLSFTKNYYEEGMHFFKPKIHWQGVKDGQTVSECPILNYTGACLWKVFGEHEYIYRLMEYLIFIAAMFMLFNTILRFYRSSALAFFITSVFLTSPLLVYYSLNFIADVPALSLCILCYCFFLRFYHSRRQRYFYQALLFGTLAVLMKASALMGLGLLVFFTLIDILNLNRFFKTEKLFEKKTLPLAATLLSIGLIVGWYRFALYYNNYNNNNVFLLTVLPIWDMDHDTLVYNLKLLFNNLFPMFLNRPMFFFFFCFVIYVIGHFRKLPAFFKYSFVFSAIFFVMYILFFFQVFSVHDYYLNNLMIFPVITFICFAQIVSGTQFLQANKVFIAVFLFFLVTFNAMYAAAVYRLRMIEDDKLAAWFPFISKEEMDLAKWVFWEYGKSRKQLETITPDLRKAGINRLDRVLSVPDDSPDISLYLMDQKGLNISRHDFANDPDIIHRFKGFHIKYLVVSDTTVEREAAFQKVRPELELFLSKKQVQVYKFKTPL